MMKAKMWIILAILGMGLLAGSAGGGPDDRFKGGSYDGYDSDGVLNTPTVNARYKGGSYDGFGLGVVYNESVLPTGTLIMVQ